MRYACTQGQSHAKMMGGSLQHPKGQPSTALTRFTLHQPQPHMQQIRTCSRNTARLAVATLKSVAFSNNSRHAPALHGSETVLQVSSTSHQHGFYLRPQCTDQHYSSTLIHLQCRRMEGHHGSCPTAGGMCLQFNNTIVITAQAERERERERG